MNTTIEKLVIQKTQNPQECIEGRTYYSFLVFVRGKEQYLCKLDSSLTCEYQGRIYENPNNGNLYPLCNLMENKK